MAFSFENLQIWNLSRTLVTDVYKVLKKFPAEEKYALCDQIRRAAISVPSNIAEGSGRMALKEKVHFCEIAYASLMELWCQLTIAFDLGYIESDELEYFRPEFDKLSYKLSAYRYSLLNPKG